MSFGGFGVSAGDAVTLGNLAWKVYKACKLAPSEFEELSREVASLHTALREVDDEVQNVDSLLNRSDGQKKTELEGILANCRPILTDLERLLSKHESLSKSDGGKAKPWDKLKFGSKDLGSVREKIVIHSNALSLFLQTLGTGSLGRIEKVLDDLVQEVRAGKRETTTMIVFGEHNEPQDVHWNSLENVLHKEGIPQRELEAHKNGIRAYLQEQVEKFHLPVRGFRSEAVRPSQDDNPVPGPTSPSEGTTRVPSTALTSSSNLSLNSSIYNVESNDSREAWEEASTEVQEYDNKGHLRKRTISYSSVSSLRSNGFSSPFMNNAGRSSFSSMRSPSRNSWEAVPSSSVPISESLALTTDAGPSRLSMEVKDPSTLADKTHEQHDEAATKSRPRKRDKNIKASDRIRELEAKVQELTERSENQDKDMDLLTYVVSSLKTRLDNLAVPKSSDKREAEDTSIPRSQPQVGIKRSRREISLDTLDSRMDKLALARDHYRKERNFFKEIAVRFGWLEQGRPPSPAEV